MLRAPYKSAGRASLNIKRKTEQASWTSRSGALWWRRRKQMYTIPREDEGCEAVPVPQMRWEQMPIFQRTQLYSETTLSYLKRLAEILAKGFMPTQAPPRERLASPITSQSALCYKEHLNKKGSEELKKGLKRCFLTGIKNQNEGCCTPKKKSNLVA